jgi:hypothetical protein
VEEHKPVLRILHEEDGDWQFLCGGIHESKHGRLICGICMLQDDPSLIGIEDLQPGHVAIRSPENERVWQIEAIPPVDDPEGEIERPTFSTKMYSWLLKIAVWTKEKRQ